MKITRRVESVIPSLTLEITSLAKQMKAEGKRIVNFAAGEPDFDPPEYIKQAAIAAIKAGFTKYTPATGTRELKQAIAQKLEQDNHLQYSPSQIVVSCGAKHALYYILQVLCEKGDGVLFASPYWVSYPQMVNLAEAQACIIPTDPENNFKLDKDSLECKINKRTKVLILNSPGNPAGGVYSHQELKQISEIAIQKDLYVISDEIYEKLIFDGKTHTSLASLNKQIYNRTIVVNGVSKAYAMTGWRIGYLACACEKIVKAITNLQSHSTSNPCSISQKAACKALGSREENQIQKTVGEFQSRRDCMLEGLRRVAALSCVKPQGAFYLFCNISQTGLDSVTFARRLLKEAEIVVVPGIAFGRDDYIRLSFATGIEQIEEGMRRMKNWVEKQD